MSSREETTEVHSVPFTSHLSNCQHRFSLLTFILTSCLRQCLPGFSTGKLVFFSLPLHSVFLGKKISMSCPHSRRGVLLHLLEGWVSTSIIWNSLWRFVSSPPQMYWFVYLLYQYGLIGFLLFTTLGYNTILLLLFRLFQLWSLWALSVVSSVLFK